jgi:alanine-synthesizing transaminase
MFSRRVPAKLTPNALTHAAGRARRAGRRLLDLTVSNPTIVGLAYPSDLLAPLSAASALEYAPEPLGPVPGREAVAHDYGRRGVAVDAGRVGLTASTSEAYSLIFKLLCDAGDEVLVPQPSYPLFDHLARLDLVEIRPYGLDPHGGWCLDVEPIRAAVSARTRAIVVVTPNNPTGSCLGEGEFARLDELAAARGLAVISDEVFADYPVSPGSDTVVSVLSRPRRALSFALGGLSKSTGLPQVKLGWFAVGGPDPVVREALGRLEIIADAYLSVGTPVALAASWLFERGRVVREAIAARIRRNLGVARRVAAAHPWCDLQPVGGGWTAVLRVPAVRTEEGLCLALVEERHVLVHPGYFFDFPTEAYLVVSLLTPPEAFEEGMVRICELVEVR